MFDRHNSNICDITCNSFIWMTCSIVILPPLRRVHFWYHAYIVSPNACHMISPLIHIDRVRSDHTLARNAYVASPTRRAQSLASPYPPPVTPRDQVLMISLWWRNVYSIIYDVIRWCSPRWSLVIGFAVFCSVTPEMLFYLEASKILSDVKVVQIDQAHETIN